MYNCMFTQGRPFQPQAPPGPAPPIGLGDRNIRTGMGGQGPGLANWNDCSWDCNSHVGVCAWSARVPPGTAEPHPGESARGAAACVLAGASAEPSGRLTRGCALVATPFAVRGWTLQWDFRDLPNPAVWPAHRTGPYFNPPPRPLVWPRQPASKIEIYERPGSGL